MWVRASKTDKSREQKDDPKSKEQKPIFPQGTA